MSTNQNQALFPINLKLSQNLDYLKTDGSVAVIMRTKNRPILLARAIESVIQQTYKNWHLYLINDGGDIEIVDEVVEYNSNYLMNKITIIHNSNSLGMEAASNCGFNIAIEEFVVVHDDDDSWNPNFLEETVNYLNTNKNAVAVLTKCKVIHETIIDDTVKELCTFDWPYWNDFVDIRTLLKGNISPPICLLIRMKVAKYIGNFNENLPVLGDWDYNLRLFRVGEIKTISKILAYYHHRPNTNNDNIYANSIIGGRNLHKEYEIQYRNSLVRKSLIENQANYGILHLLLNEIETTSNNLSNNILNLNNLINELNLRLCDTQEKVAYLQRKSFPLKRFAKKIREMIKKWK